MASIPGSGVGKVLSPISEGQGLHFTSNLIKMDSKVIPVPSRQLGKQKDGGGGRGRWQPQPHYSLQNNKYAIRNQLEIFELRCEFFVVNPHQGLFFYRFLETA